MKKILFLVFATLLASTAYSQDRPRERRMPNREINPEEFALTRTQQLQEVLQLDSLQFQAIFLMNYSDAMAMQDSIKARGSDERRRPSDEERKARMEVMQKRQEIRNQQMQQILTAEQYEKYLKYQEEQEKSRRPRGDRRAPSGNRPPRNSQ